jgi:hypothetical protein
MDDLVATLRKAAKEPCDGCCFGDEMVQAADEIARLRAALAEIVVRTMPYQDDHEGWPLVAGVHRVAHDALADTAAAARIDFERNGQDRW